MSVLDAMLNGTAVGFGKNLNRSLVVRAIVALAQHLLRRNRS